MRLAVRPPGYEIMTMIGKGQDLAIPGNDLAAQSSLAAALLGAAA